MNAAVSFNASPINYFFFSASISGPDRQA